jgi:hypothetical protein
MTFNLKSLSPHQIFFKLKDEYCLEILAVTASLSHFKEIMKFITSIFDAGYAAEKKITEKSSIALNTKVVR